MNRPALLLKFCLLAAPAAASADGAPAGDVTLRAESPVIALAGVAPGRHFVDLPTLEYAFEVVAECTGERVVQSLSINVADSRATLSAGEFEPARPRQLVLRIPASQTPPLAVGDFCALEDPHEGAPAALAPVASRFAPSRAGANPMLLEVPDALSAQISLMCGDGEERSVIYASQPLGVTLTCELPILEPAAETPAAGDP